ncbi:MAG: protein-L-isoaspartate(D-aspartate) O-methyltransferase [Gammaproteobacteria bacterium]
MLLPRWPDQAMADVATRRARMVTHQLVARGIQDPKVLDAMGSVPREQFVPAESAVHAYEDRPLALLAGQTISQPYIVALMIEALQLQGGERVLDIGTGSGYAAAVLSRIAAWVDSVERIPELLAFAEPRLSQLNYDNISTHLGDGTMGWPENAPYDAILVSAAGPAIPAQLRVQLAPGGRLVMPVGPELGSQMLWRETRTGTDDYTRESLGEVRFVPLLGEQGWRV